MADRKNEYRRGFNDEDTFLGVVIQSWKGLSNELVGREVYNFHQLYSSISGNCCFSSFFIRSHCSQSYFA